MEIFNNPWIVGIGGGILSGLVVAWITRKIFSKRDDREYFQKIRAANQEVLYAIRPGISEEKIPSIDVIKHLISATARKYSVESQSMLTLSEISSELIKEVMDSSFISANTKQEFCEKLTSIKEDLPSTSESATAKSEAEISGRYRRQLVSVMAVMTGVMTSIAAVIALKEDTLLLTNEKNLFLIILPAAVAVGVALLSTMVKELEKTKMSRLSVNFAGLKAEFEAKNSKSESTLNKASKKDAQ